MTNPFRRIPLGAVVGGTLMSALVAWGFADTVLVRHELMHAAIWRQTMRHPCAYFNAALGTYTGQGCD